MKTTYLILWALVTALCCFLSFQFCCGGNIGETAGDHFYLTGQNGFKVKCEYNGFVKSNYELTNPIDRESACYSQAAEFLEKNPNQALVIEGLYAESEENTSIYSNLGVARASQLKRELASMFSIPASRMKTSYQLVNEERFVADSLKDAYRLRFEAANEVSDFSNFDTEKTITLNFNTGSSTPIMNELIRNDFGQFISYLESNPTSSILVTGHTDTTGDADRNMELGQQRAEEIKQYLVRNGISGSRINTDSRGEEEPISESDAENRRVTVNIQTNNEK